MPIGVVLNWAKNKIGVEKAAKSLFENSMKSVKIKFSKTENKICQLCNLSEEEDMVHLIGKRPITKIVKKRIVL